MTVPSAAPTTAVTPDLMALPRQSTAALPNLIGMTREQLRAALMDVGVAERQAKMRERQIWAWLYQRGVQSFDAMSNLSKDLRAKLAEHFTLDRPEIVTRQISKDGTRKYLLRIEGGHEVCSFCHTGTQNLVRNLTAGEIVGQIMVCRDDLDEWPEEGATNTGEKRLLSNIVLMGMGEPLYNFDAVRDAMKIAMDNEGISLSRRRITLSTSGVVPLIARAGEEIGTMLAISLHGTTDDIRNTLVPINKKWNVETLMQACRDYPKLSNSERITFEYVMLDGVNDTNADAKRLVKLIEGIPAKINLIPFNPWPGAPYKRSSWDRIEAFADIVNKAGYASPVRTPRGQDIMAACGQLKSATERARKVRPSEQV